MVTCTIAQFDASSARIFFVLTTSAQAVTSTEESENNQKRLPLTTPYRTGLRCSSLDDGHSRQAKHHLVRKVNGAQDGQQNDHDPAERRDACAVGSLSFCPAAAIQQFLELMFSAILNRFQSLFLRWHRNAFHSEQSVRHPIQRSVLL